MTDKTVTRGASGRPYKQFDVDGDESYFADVVATLPFISPDLVVANFTRPADTTAYAAGDVVADSTSAPTVITFNSVARKNGGHFYLVGAHMTSSGNEATKPQFELWLFNAAPGLDNDNAAFTPTDAEIRTVLAVIQFNTWFEGTAGAGGNSWAAGVVNPDDALIECGAAVDDVYGELVVRNAYTPISAERFDITLQVVKV